mgnify:CR=1 FL=1
MVDFEALDEYVSAHVDAEPAYLHALYRATQLHLLYPRMASGHVQGRLLKMLVRMVRPQRVLELGTYSGYSALCLAEGLEEGGVVHTVEVNDEQEDFTRRWIEGSPWGHRVRLHIGDAMEVVPRLGLTFDLVLIDADKRRYVDYYELVMPWVRKGGYILADNTLWDGHVLEPAGGVRDAQTLGIMAFNDRVAQDGRVERVIVPVRDGLTIIRKLEN